MDINCFQNLLSLKFYQLGDPCLSKYVPSNDLKLSLQTSKILATRDAELDAVQFSFNIRNRMINCFAFY